MWECLRGEGLKTFRVHLSLSGSSVHQTADCEGKMLSTCPNICKFNVYIKTICDIRINQSWPTAVMSISNLSLFSFVPCSHPPLLRLIAPQGLFIGRSSHSWDFTSPAPHANSFTPVITHTFQIFIIKRIRLCSLNIFFQEAYFGAVPGCLLFRHSSGGAHCSAPRSLSLSLPHPPAASQPDSLFHGSVQRSLQTWCQCCFVKLQGRQD